MADTEEEPKQSDVLCPTSTQDYLKMRRPTLRFKRTLLVLGAVEIILGAAFCALIVIIDVFTRSYYPSEGQPAIYEIFGAWDGVSIFASGVIALIAYYRPSKCVFLTNFALSIVIANSLLVRAVIASASADFFEYYSLYICNILSASVFFISMVVFIIHFIYFGFALSCCSCASSRRNTEQEL